VLRGACSQNESGGIINTSRTSPINDHRSPRYPQLRYRSVGTFITIKIPQTSVHLNENRILVSRLPRSARMNAIRFSSTPIQVVPHIAVVVTIGLKYIFVCIFGDKQLSLGIQCSWSLVDLLDCLCICSCFCHCAVGLPLVRQGCRH